MTTIIENGNCLDLMSSLPDKSVDLLICDLPYGQINRDWDSIIDMVEFWKQFKRIRKSKRVACIHFCTTKFGYSLIKSWEKGFKMDMVWKKRQKTGALSSRFRPMRDHEMIYFFYEQAPKYNRDKYHKKIREVIQTPKKDRNGEKTIYGLPMGQPAGDVYDVPNPASVINEVVDDDDGEKTIYGMSMGTTVTNQGTRRKPPNPGSVINEVIEEEETREYTIYGMKHVDIPKVSPYEPPNPGSVIEGDVGRLNRYHVTQKPQSILEFLVKYWSDEGDTILDPTMGGGSTGVACQGLQRNFIGYELDEDIFEVARERLGQ
jgi:DNA modification methylase